MIYQFLGMETKNYKFGMFCQQCHPSVASGDADIRPRNASRIPTCHLFTSLFCLYLQFGESGRQIPRAKLLEYCFQKSCQLSGKVVEGLDCTASKTKAKLDPQANFPRWRPPDLHADAGREAHQKISKICQFLIAEICSIFLNKVC